VLNRLSLSRDSGSKDRKEAREAIDSRISSIQAVW
jgi:hypothetical protein